MNLFSQIWKHRKRRSLGDIVALVFGAGVVAALVIVGVLVKSCFA